MNWKLKRKRGREWGGGWESTWWKENKWEKVKRTKKNPQEDRLHPPVPLSDWPRTRPVAAATDDITVWNTAGEGGAFAASCHPSNRSMCVCVRVMRWLPHLSLEGCLQFSFMLSSLFLLVSFLHFVPLEVCHLTNLTHFSNEQDELIFYTLLFFQFCPFLYSFHLLIDISFHLLFPSAFPLIPLFLLPSSLVFSVFSRVYHKWIDGVPT